MAILDTATQCVDIVRSAVYNSGTIDMDYGTDTLYFEVVAANFATFWYPTFQATTGSLAGDQTWDIGWAYTKPDAISGNFIEPERTGLTDAASFTAADSIYTNETTTVGGVSIYVRVVIHNNTYPTLTTSLFGLAVDGQDATDQWDLVNDLTASNCSDPTKADQNDIGYYNITPRPDIDDLDPTNATYDDESTTPGTPNEQIHKNDSGS